MKVISFNFNEKKEECELSTTSAFDSFHDVAKMDCLIDAISDLEKFKSNLSLKMYGEQND